MESGLVGNNLARKLKFEKLATCFQFPVSDWAQPILPWT